MASRDRDEQESLRAKAWRMVDVIKDNLLLPVRLLTSKFALRAYITTILFIFTALLLFAIAVLSYIAFYWSYIPQIGFSRDIHLQYDPIPLECRSYLSTQLALLPVSQHLLTALTGQQQEKGEIATLQAARCGGSPAPWGTAPVTPEVISAQAYDVVVELEMPRTPVNTETGVFMVDARLLTSSPASSSAYASEQVPDYTNPFDPAVQSTSLSRDRASGDAGAAAGVVAHARRPASLPYASPLLALTSTLLSVPRHVFGLQTDMINLRLPLFTAVSFPAGRRVAPSKFHLQLLNPLGRQLQVRRCRVHFRARFTGLRYVMYNFRLLSAGVFVGVFFAAEVMGALVVYGVLQFVVLGGNGKEEGKKISSGRREGSGEEGSLRDSSVKTEEDDVTDFERSEAERQFPSYGGQPPLRYPGTGGARVKKEDTGEGSAVATMTPGPGGEADDEDDEDADYVLDDPAGRWRDSGMGTSMESGRESGVRRRRSRGSSRDGPLR